MVLQIFVYIIMVELNSETIVIINHKPFLKLPPKH